MLLLREEMRRVLRYLEWQAQWWRDQATRRNNWDAATATGAEGYALKQAAWSARLGGYLRGQWELDATTLVQEMIAFDGLVAAEDDIAQNTVD